MLRVVNFKEKKQRGCWYCTNKQVTKDMGSIRTACPYKVCPYRELDKYDSYEEFLGSDDSKILVDGFFHTSASCYELANGNVTVKQIYGGTRFDQLF